MAKQASLGYKRFCEGIYPETEDADAGADWISWAEAFEILLRSPAARETPPDWRTDTKVCEKFDGIVQTVHKIEREMGEDPGIWIALSLDALCEAVAVACAVPTGGR